MPSLMCVFKFSCLHGCGFCASVIRVSLSMFLILCECVFWVVVAVKSRK